MTLHLLHSSGLTLCEGCLRLLALADAPTGLCPGCRGQTGSDRCLSTAQALGTGDWRCLQPDQQAGALAWTPSGGLVLRPQHRGSSCPS
jgi:hypothetical protein